MSHDDELLSYRLSYREILSGLRRTLRGLRRTRDIQRASGVTDPFLLRQGYLVDQVIALLESLGNRIPTTAEDRLLRALSEEMVESTLDHYKVPSDEVETFLGADDPRKS